MQFNKPSEIIKQSIYSRPTALKIPDVAPSTDADYRKPSGGGVKPVRFDDPQNSHRFLVPPHDNFEPNEETNIEKNGDLTLAGERGYQDIGAMYIDPIYEGDVREQSFLVANETASFTPGAPTDIRDLGSKGGASGEYLSTAGGNKLFGEPLVLSMGEKTATAAIPKRQVGSEFASLSMARMGPPNLIAGLTLGVLGQTGSILLSSFLIGLGVAAGSACFRIATAWIQKKYFQKDEPYATTVAENRTPTGTHTPSITGSYPVNGPTFSNTLQSNGMPETQT